MPSGDSNAVNVRVAQRPPLVLVCAGTPDSRTWDASRPTLATRYSVIEFRGDGAPTAWDALDPDRAIDRLVARLADWIARLALPAVHLCGHGAGGVVAQRFAFEFPCSVAALVLEGTLPAPPGAPVSHLSDTPSIASATGAASGALVAGAPVLRSSYHEEHLPTLGTLAVPTLVTVGERDSPRFQMGAELLHGWIPNSRLVRVAGAGHTPHSERPVSFCCHVLDFLADVDKQGATSGTPG